MRKRARQSRWSLLWRITDMPTPWPGDQRVCDLLSRFWSQGKPQTGPITSSTDNPRGIVRHAGVMQESQLTASQVGLTTMEIQQPLLSAPIVEAPLR